MLRDGPKHKRLQVSPQDGIFCCRRLISGKGVAADPLD